jgi:hypothetical protein
MPRVNLRVPFQDKDEAKRLGARWDASARTWFVPDELEPSRFKRWLTQDEEANVRADSYFIASSTRRCWRCGATSPVHGFLLPAGHERLEVDDDEDEDAIWERSEEPTLLCYLDWLAPGVVARVMALTRHYRFGYSKETASFYWRNRCEFCDVPFGDHETFCEPGQGFLAFSREDARRITLHHVNEAFVARCGSYSIGVTLFEAMNRR